MANRYLVASGNWNSTSVWSATSGGAGGASFPVLGDIAWFNTNFTVTLTADAVCSEIRHTNGTLNMSSFKLTVWGTFAFNSSGNLPRTINMGSGLLEVIPTSSGGTGLILTGSNLTLNAGTSRLIINKNVNGNIQFNTLGKTFNDVTINVNGTISGGADIYIDGSPTFRSLFLRVTSNQAHAVVFNSDITVTSKFMASAISTTNRLLLTESAGYFIRLGPLASSYGQFIDADIQATNLTGTATPTTQAYIGSNSVDSTSSWLLQDPPTVDTFVDKFLVSPSSNSDWLVSTYSGASLPVLTNTGSRGGGYRFDNNDGMFTKGTYDLINSNVIIEIPPTLASKSDQQAIWFGWADSDGDVGQILTDGGGNQFMTGAYAGFGMKINRFSNTLNLYFATTYSAGDPLPVSASAPSAFSLPTSGTNYIRFRYNLSDSKVYVYVRSGNSWTQVAVSDAYTNYSEFLRSSRIYIRTFGNANTIDIGSFNSLPQLKFHVYTSVSPFTLDVSQLDGNDRLGPIGTGYYWEERICYVRKSGVWVEYTPIVQD